MDDFDFTEDEIREQLDILGYSNVPPERLQEFKRDLESLVRHERSKNSSLFSTSEQSSSSESEAARGTRTHINGLSRPPLDDTNHRQPTSSTGNANTARTNIQNHHSTYGKENVYIVPPTMHTIPEPKQSQSENDLRGLGQVSQHVPDYSLYMEPQGGLMLGESTRVREDGQGEVDTTLDTSTTSTERRIMKRKVLRKRDGHKEIYETESESGDIDSLQDRLRNLGLSVDLSRPATAPPGRQASAATYTCRAISARDPDPSYRLPEDYEGPKALIRPMKCEPHMKNVRKSDPVSKFQQYRTSWECHRAPGEKAHKGLRWGVREQMLYHDKVVDKKQKVFIPNNYKVPTDKKRKNLRWQIRNDLAQGVVPPSMFD